MNSQSKLLTAEKNISVRNSADVLDDSPKLPDVLDDHTDNTVMSQRSHVACLILKQKL